MPDTTTTRSPTKPAARRPPVQRPSPPVKTSPAKKGGVAQGSPVRAAREQRAAALAAAAAGGAQVAPGGAQGQKGVRIAKQPLTKRQFNRLVEGSEINLIFKGILSKVIKEKPDDPFAFVAAEFKKHAGKPIKKPSGIAKKTNLHSAVPKS